MQESAEVVPAEARPAVLAPTGAPRVREPDALVLHVELVEADLMAAPDLRAVGDGHESGRQRVVEAVVPVDPRDYRLPGERGQRGFQGRGVPVAGDQPGP